MADTIYDWSWTSSSFNASGTLDVVGGYAISGSGAIGATSLIDPGQSLVLIPASSPGAEVTGIFAGGLNLSGDNAVNATAPLLSNSGLVFSVGTYTGTRSNDGFNPWANSATDYEAAGGNTGGGPSFFDEHGTFSLNAAPVPLPAAVWLLLSSLGGLGVFARKRGAELAPS
jgi:hypothetical protein